MLEDEGARSWLRSLRCAHPFLTSPRPPARTVEERCAQIRAATERAIEEVRREIAHTFVVGQRVFVPGSYFVNELTDGSEIDREHVARWGAVAWHEAIVTKTYPPSVPIPHRKVEIEYVERGSGRQSLGTRYVDEIPVTLLKQWRDSRRAAQGLGPWGT